MEAPGRVVEHAAGKHEWRVLEQAARSGRPLLDSQGEYEWRVVEHANGEHEWRVLEQAATSGRPLLDSQGEHEWRVLEQAAPSGRPLLDSEGGHESRVVEHAPAAPRGCPEVGHQARNPWKWLRADFEVVQATLPEPDPVKIEERVEMLQGIVRRAPFSLLYDLAEAFGRAGVDIGKCESWTDTGLAFLRANVVRSPEIWCAKWYNYTFLHGTTLPKAAYILHENMVRPYSWGDQDYPSYAFYARVVQSELEQWAVKSLCKKIMTIGKGQQGALILGLMRSPMQHAKMQAGGTMVEQHAARHAYIVRGVDGRFAVRSDYAVPTAVIVHWPEWFLANTGQRSRAGVQPGALRMRAECTRELSSIPVIESAGALAEVFVDVTRSTERNTMALAILVITGFVIVQQCIPRSLARIFSDDPDVMNLFEYTRWLLVESMQYFMPGWRALGTLAAMVAAAHDQIDGWIVILYAFSCVVNTKLNGVLNLEAVQAGKSQALMELRPSIVQNLGDNINLRKAFFVSSQSAVDSAVTAVVHYILLREALRDSLASMEDVAQRLHAAGVKYCKYFPSNDLAQAVSSLRLCNISPRE
ncbi:unnamed protein product, partial [Symbiodinium microadriaticum]